MSPYGGFKSVRVDSYKPLIIIGQNEAWFNHLLIGTK